MKEQMEDKMNENIETPKAEEVEEDMDCSSNIAIPTTKEEIEKIMNGNLSEEEKADLLDRIEEAKKEKMKLLEAEAEGFILDNQIQVLFQNEPFWSAMSCCVTKKRTFEIPTAGVYWNKTRMCYGMYYNPAFLNRIFKMNPTFVKSVLIHELSHIALGHVSPRNEMKYDKKQAPRWNVSMDIAINYMIEKENLPPGLCWHSNPPHWDLPGALSAEDYFNLLPKMEGSEVEYVRGDNEDEHGNFGDGGGDGEGKFREMERRRIVERSEKETQSKGWGSVHADMQRELEKYLHPKLDWRGILKAFVGGRIRSDKKSSVRKLNRRQPYDYAGVTRNRTAKIAISIDQSGSVGDDMLMKFFGELHHLCSHTEFTVIPFDSEVVEDKVYVWKKNENRKVERVSCGGTNFDAPTEYVNVRDFDGHLILTDMEAPKPVPSRCPRLWITTEGNKCNFELDGGEFLIEIPNDDSGKKEEV